MKAIEMYGYGGVEQLRYEDVPTPHPGPDQVVVKVAETASIRSTGRSGAAT